MVWRNSLGVLENKKERLKRRMSKLKKKIEKINQEARTYIEYDKDGLVIESGRNLFISCLVNDVSFGPWEVKKDEESLVLKKEPTHEEILMKWWKNNFGDWIKIVRYQPDTRNYYDSNKDYYRKDWFINRESATIPKEV